MQTNRTPVALTIIPGAVLIEGSEGKLRSGECVVVDIATASKYPCVLSWSNGFESGDVPSVLLAADDRTLGLDTTQDRLSSTTVNFPGYPGWRVVSADASRRTVSVTLHKEMASNDGPVQHKQLPSPHPWIKAAQAFSSDPIRQADFLAG